MSFNNLTIKKLLVTLARAVLMGVESRLGGEIKEANFPEVCLKDRVGGAREEKVKLRFFLELERIMFVWWKKGKGRIQESEKEGDLLNWVLEEAREGGRKGRGGQLVSEMSRGSC